MIDIEKCRRVKLHQMFVSERREYVWVTNPKVGTTTVKQLIAEDEGLVEPGKLIKVHQTDLFRNITAARFRNDLQVLVDILNGNSFKFCFVRNPYTRLASAYRNKIDKKDSRIGERATKPRSQIMQALGRGRLDTSSSISFADFVQAIQILKESSGLRRLDRHWRPQYNNVMIKLIDYDFIGRMETFKGDLLTVASRANIPLNESMIPHRNSKKSQEASSSENSQVNIRDLIDEKSERIIRSLYAKDFEIFNYDPQLR